MTWAERRHHDLMVSHRVDEYFNPYDAERAEQLIAQIVEYEALAHKVCEAGGDARDLEQIEEHAWPIRETLRILDRENLLPVIPRERVPAYLL